MRTNLLYTIVSLAILLSISACSQPTPAASVLPALPTAQTLPAASQTSPSSSTPTHESAFTPTSPNPTNTLNPTNTTNPTPACYNRAEFVKHLTVGDNTVLKPGEYFAKLWRIKNIGTCTWTQKYSLVFVSGEAMQGPQSMPLAKNVPPGETIDLRVDLVAPLERNAHTGSWLLQDSLGNLFGVGESADQAIEVTIFIKPTPRPTSS